MNKWIPGIAGAWLNILAVAFPGVAGKKGYYFFCTPVAPPVTEKHLRFLNTAERYSMPFEGYTIETYKWGKGPKKILFLHGWQSHSFRWKKYIDMFPGDEFTLYALDAPAHGLSGGKYIHLPLYASVIEKFIDARGPFHAVVTHSFGGFAILYACYQRPEMAVGMIVLTAVPGEVSDFVKLYRSVLRLSAGTMRAVLRYWLTQVQHPPEYYSAEKFARSMSLPALIIHDKDDRETSYDYAVRIHHAWESSQMITTTGLGHNLKSVEVINWILGFVRQGQVVGSESAPID